MAPNYQIPGDAYGRYPVQFLDNISQAFFAVDGHEGLDRQTILNDILDAVGGEDALNGNFKVELPLYVVHDIDSCTGVYLKIWSTLQDPAYANYVVKAELTNEKGEKCELPDVGVYSTKHIADTLGNPHNIAKFAAACTTISIMCDLPTAGLQGGFGGLLAAVGDGAACVITPKMASMAVSAQTGAAMTNVGGYSIPLAPLTGGMFAHTLARYGRMSKAEKMQDTIQLRNALIDSEKLLPGSAAQLQSELESLTKGVQDTIRATEKEPALAQALLQNDDIAAKAASNTKVQDEVASAIMKTLQSGDSKQIKGVLEDTGIVQELLKNPDVVTPPSPDAILDAMLRENPQALSKDMKTVVDEYLKAISSTPDIKIAGHSGGNPIEVPYTSSKAEMPVIWKTGDGGIYIAKYPSNKVEKALQEVEKLAPEERSYKKFRKILNKLMGTKKPDAYLKISADSAKVVDIAATTRMLEDVPQLAKYLGDDYLRSLADLTTTTQLDSVRALKYMSARDSKLAEEAVKAVDPQIVQTEKDKILRDAVKALFKEKGIDLGDEEADKLVKAIKNTENPDEVKEIIADALLKSGKLEDLQKQYLEALRAVMDAKKKGYIIDDKQFRSALKQLGIRKIGDTPIDEITDLAEVEKMRPDELIQQSGGFGKVLANLKSGESVGAIRTALQAISNKFKWFAWLDKTYREKLATKKGFRWLYEQGERHQISAALLCGAAGQAAGTLTVLGGLQTAPPNYIDVKGKISDGLTVEVKAGNEGPWVVHIGNS
ncbi:hypothetical protein [Thermococcus sp.]